jgi:hypothetical protein
VTAARADHLIRRATLIAAREAVRLGDRTTDHLKAARASELTREVGRTTLDSVDRHGAKP